jgi:hypothetical protein
LAERAARAVPRVSALLGVVAVLGCAKPTPETKACFTLRPHQNSASTRAVFAERRCQGGGVTWAELLRVLSKRRGRIEPVVEPAARWSGEVARLDGTTLFSIDEEGDAARFCTADPTLLRQVRADVEALNADAAALGAAMSEASPLGLECLQVNGGTPSLELPARPALPAELLGDGRSARDHLRRAIAATPTWCFPETGVDGIRGALRLHADGTAMLDSAGDGGPALARGRWRLPAEDDVDTRLEVQLPGAGAGLYHFDLSDSGHLGFTRVGASPTRVELTPGPACR